jgi:DNA-binding response OmpR family regulator
MRCILIDDDEEEIDIFRHAIKSIGFEAGFHGYTSFHAAMNDLTDPTGFPDYIFVDGFLNQLTGKEVLQHIKANRALSKIPVIIYSGYVSESDQEELTGLGAYAVMRKPSGIAQLSKQLNALLKGR